MTKAKKFLIAGLAAASALSAQSLAKATLNAGIPAAASQVSAFRDAYVQVGGTDTDSTAVAVTMAAGAKEKDFSGKFAFSGGWGSYDAVKVIRIWARQTNHAVFGVGADVKWTNDRGPYGLTVEFSGKIHSSMAWKFPRDVVIAVSVEYEKYKRTQVPVTYDVPHVIPDVPADGKDPDSK